MKALEQYPYQMTFDKKNHMFEMRGVNIPSVTQILKHCGILDTRFYKKGAAERGTHLHLLLQYFDERVLDLDALDIDDLTFLGKYIDFLRDHDFKVLLNEVQIEDTERKFAGLVDKIVLNSNGKKTIIEVKTGTPEPWHLLQLAAYQIAVKAMTGMALDAKLLYLSSKYKYKVVNLTDGSALQFSVIVHEYWSKRNKEEMEGKMKGVIEKTYSSEGWSVAFPDWSVAFPFKVLKEMTPEAMTTVMKASILNVSGYDVDEAAANTRIAKTMTQTLEILTPDDRKEADKYRHSAREMKKRAENECEPLTATLSGWHKLSVSLRTMVTKPCDEIVDLIDKMTQSYDLEQLRIESERKKEIQEKADKETQRLKEEADAKIKKAESDAEVTAIKEEIQAATVAIETSAVSQLLIPEDVINTKIEGVWEGTVTNFTDLPDAFKMVDEAKIKEYIKDQKRIHGDIQPRPVPGLTFKQAVKHSAKRGKR